MSIAYDKVYVPLPGTERGSSVKLGVSPDGKKISYPSLKGAIVKNLEVPGDGAIYPTVGTCTVAKLSPAGFHCAVGDNAGNFKVFDTLNATVKLESKPISNIIDVAWDGESKRLVVVGEGRGAFGATFSLDTGTSIGEVSGHSKRINAVALKKQRPFRAATASDDATVCILNGVPFKYASQVKRHTRFVQTADYSPDGSQLVTGGSDGLLFLYDKDGQETGVLEDGKQAHDGTIFSAAFSPDGKLIASVSADKTVKIWDAAAKSLIHTISLPGQQVGSVWLTPSTLVALSFEGLFVVIDAASGSIIKTITGHNSPVTALAYDAATDALYSGDSNGFVKHFSSEGTATDVSNGHSNLVLSILPGLDGAFYTASYDDTVKAISGGKFTDLSIPTSAIPKGLALGKDAVFILTARALLKASTKGEIATTLPLDEPSTIALSPDGALVAVAIQNTVTLFDATDLKPKGKIELRNPITALAFSPNCEVLAVGDSTGKVPLYNSGTLDLVLNRWSFTTARITSLAWDASGAHLAVGSLDESVRVYKKEKPSFHLFLKNTHRGGVNALVWTSPTSLASAGADGAIRTYKVQFD